VPSGGSAYGTPRKVFVYLSSNPKTTPNDVSTVTVFLFSLLFLPAPAPSFVRYASVVSKRDAAVPLDEADNTDESEEDVMAKSTSKVSLSRPFFSSPTTTAGTIQDRMASRSDSLYMKLNMAPLLFHFVLNIISSQNSIVIAQQRNTLRHTDAI
jgi:hypothetical protein